MKLCPQKVLPIIRNKNNDNTSEKSLRRKGLDISQRWCYNIDSRLLTQCHNEDCRRRTNYFFETKVWRLTLPNWYYQLLSRLRLNWSQNSTHCFQPQAHTNMYVSKRRPWWIMTKIRKFLMTFNSNDGQPTRPSCLLGRMVNW